MFRDPAKQTGVTFVEIVITVLIIGILAAVAVPSYRDYIDRQRLTGALESIYGQVQLAKREAISNNDTRYLRILSDSGTWCAFVSNSSSSTCSDASLYSHGRDYPGVDYETTDDTFEFRMPDMSSLGGSITLSNSSGDETISISENLQVSVN